MVLNFLSVRKRYPVEAIIIEGFNNYKLKHDRMTRKIDKESGHEYYTFHKAKGEYKPVPYDKILPSDTGLTAILFSPASGQYFLTEIVMPLETKTVKTSEFINNELVETTKEMTLPIIRPIRESIRQTATVIHHRIDLRYPKGKTWFEKYSTIILVVIWAVAIAVPMIFYPSYISSVGGQLGGLVDQMSKIVSDMGIATQGLSHIGGAVTPPPV